MTSSISAQDILREAGIQAVFDTVPYHFGGSTLYPVREAWHFEQLKRSPAAREIASAEALATALATRDDERILLVLPSAAVGVRELETRLERSAFSHTLAFLEA